jgi:hypothetical protein
MPPAKTLESLRGGRLHERQPVPVSVRDGRKARPPERQPRALTPLRAPPLAADGRRGATFPRSATSTLITAALNDHLNPRRVPKPIAQSPADISLDIPRHHAVQRDH